MVPLGVVQQELTVKRSILKAGGRETALRCPRVIPGKKDNGVMTMMLTLALSH